MHVFTGLAVGSGLLYIVVEVPLWIFLALAAKRLHDSMFYRVMKAPTRFYDINPPGKGHGDIRGDNLLTLTLKLWCLLLSHVRCSSFQGLC